MNDDFRAALNSYGLEEVRRWLHDRLHGLDTLCPPPDPREDERLYVRVSELHGSARMCDQFKLHVRTAVCEAMRNAARHYPQGEWTDPEALDSLLLLAVDVSEGLVRSTLKDDIAQALWELVEKLPFEVDGIPLKRFAAMALLDARTPPQQPETFWKELWAVAAADGWTGFAGVVFEGLWRHTGLETAAQWFATAKPWDEEVMLRVLDDKLPGIIADSTPDRVTNILEKHLMLPLREVTRRSAVRRVAAPHGLSLWREVQIIPEHWPILSRLMRDEHGIEHAHLLPDKHRGAVLCSPDAAAVIENLLLRFEQEKMHLSKEAKARTVWAAVGERYWIEFLEQAPVGMADALEITYSKAAQKNRRHEEFGVTNLRLEPPTIEETRMVVVLGMRGIHLASERCAQIVSAVHHAFDEPLQAVV